MVAAGSQSSLIAEESQSSSFVAAEALVAIAAVAVVGGRCSFVAVEVNRNHSFAEVVVVAGSPSSLVVEEVKETQSSSFVEVEAAVEMVVVVVVAVDSQSHNFVAVVVVGN